MTFDGFSTVSVGEWTHPYPIRLENKIFPEHRDWGKGGKVGFGVALRCMLEKEHYRTVLKQF